LLAVADDDGESPLVFFPLSLEEEEEEEEEEAAAAFPSVASLEIIVLFFSLSTFPFSYTTSRQLLSNRFFFFFGVVFVVTISLLKLISRNRCCRFYVAGYDGESPLVFLSVAAAVAASQALHPLKETIALPPDDFTIPVHISFTLSLLFFGVLLQSVG
jgi:hypothetical protein